MDANQIWGRRLKDARTVTGLSQKQLGIQVGLDPFVASTRINRYELGVHKADYKIAQRLAEILQVPTAYFYTEDDALAELMVLYYRQPKKRKSEILKSARNIAISSQPVDDA